MNEVIRENYLELSNGCSVWFKWKKSRSLFFSLFINSSFSIIMRFFLLRILIFQNLTQLHVYTFLSFHYFLLLFLGSFFFSHLFCFGLFQLLCCSYNLFLTRCLTPFSRILEERTPVFQANPWLRCFPQSTAPDDICPGYNQVLQPLPSFFLESCSPADSSPQEHQRRPLW